MENDDLARILIAAQSRLSGSNCARAIDGTRRRLHIGITEDDEDGGDRELEGSDEDLTGCVPYSCQPHVDMAASSASKETGSVGRSLTEQLGRNNAAQQGFS